MEGAEARCPGGGDLMDFSWTADGESHAPACASPGRDEEDAPPPAPALSPQEAVESMILVSGPRVVMSGLRMGDCRSGAVPVPSLPIRVPCNFNWIVLVCCPGFVELGGSLV